MKATATSVHPFEEAGLGLAPFKFIGVFEDRGPHRFVDKATGVEMEIGAPGQPMGSCAYCGQGIALCCTILSADGKRFTVGCDCVAKVARSDNRVSPILTEVERWKKERAAEKREAKRQAAWQRSLEVRAEARAALAADPSLGADRPHPMDFRAAQGATLRDYWTWCLEHGGATSWRATAAAIAAAAEAR